MSTIAPIRNAIALDLAGIATNPTISATPYIVETINPPCAIVQLKDLSYDLTMARGADLYNFVITIYAWRTAEGAAQTLFDDLSEPSGVTSVKTVLESPTSNVAALVDYLKVSTVSGPRAVSHPDGVQQFLAIDFDVEVCL